MRFVENDYIIMNTLLFYGNIFTINFVCRICKVFNQKLIKRKLKSGQIKYSAKEHLNGGGLWVSRIFYTTP